MLKLENYDIYKNAKTFFLDCSLQFCKNFRVGERCCEFECLDPPGEDNMYQVNLST